MCFVVSPVLGANNVSSNEASNSSGFDWNPVIQAIVQVESEGNTRAVSGNSCGAMQITPILVKECNDILKKRKARSASPCVTDSVWRNQRKCSFLFSHTLTH